MSLLLAILVFLLTISILIIVHEFGHFLAARMVGVDVERFAIGFGKPIAHFKTKCKTEFVFGPLLFGGYVKLAEESYQKKSPWQKMLVMIAGVVANLFLAIVILWTIYLIGIEMPKPIVGKVVPHSIAAASGLRANEEITKIDDSQTKDWQDVAFAVISRLGDGGTLQINSHNLVIDDWKVSGLNPDPLKSLGIEPYHPDSPAIIVKVMANSPAAKIGLAVGDNVVKVDGQKLQNSQDLIEFLEKKPLEKISFGVIRGHQQLTLTGTVGKKRGLDFKPYGFLGVRFTGVDWPKEKMLLHKYDFFGALLEASREARALLYFNTVVIIKMLSGKLSTTILGGPLTIFTATNIAFAQGVMIYLDFLALLSLMLVFVNALPIPGLDGGNFLMLVVEAIFRKPIPQKVYATVVKFGMLLLLCLIAIAISNDLMRVFT